MMPFCPRNDDTSSDKYCYTNFVKDSRLSIYHATHDVSPFFQCLFKTFCLFFYKTWIGNNFFFLSNKVTISDGFVWRNFYISHDRIINHVNFAAVKTIIQGEKKMTKLIANLVINHF